MTGAPPPIVALRHVTRFSCIGSACEDLCCEGSQVEVDQSRLAHIRKIVRKDPALQATFNEAVELMPLGARSRESFAQLRKNAGGGCLLLDADRLCSLQKNLGEEALPNICRAYPRSSFAMPTGLELSATLGCPEVTRLALLAPDGTDLVTSDEAQARAAGASQPIEGYSAEFLTLISRLRRRVHELLADERLPLPSRLYCAMELLNQLGQLPEDCFAQATELIDALGDGETLGELHARFQTLREGLQLNLGPVIVAAAPVYGGGLPLRFVPLSRAVLRSYLPPDAAEDAAPDLEALTQEFLRRRERVLGAFGDRVDGYLQNYLRHQWIQGWAPQLAGIGSYLRAQLLSVAALRFLLLSHPQAQEAAQDPAGGAATMDRLAVEIIYTFSRMLDNYRPAQEGYLRFVEEQVPTLEAALPLLLV